LKTLWTFRKADYVVVIIIIIIIIIILFYSFDRGTFTLLLAQRNATDAITFA
jgi:hypothetical protein